MAKKLAADQEVLAESIERVERGKRAIGGGGGDEKGSDVPSAEEVHLECLICVYVIFDLN